MTDSLVSALYTAKGGSQEAMAQAHAELQALKEDPSFGANALLLACSPEPDLSFLAAIHFRQWIEALADGFTEQERVRHVQLGFQALSQVPTLRSHRLLSEALAGLIVRIPTGSVIQAVSELTEACRLAAPSLASDSI